MSINAAAAAGDILITIFLCYLLQKSRTGFQKSDWTINKLVSDYTNGIALVRDEHISIWPHALIYIAFYYNIGRLYCNSLLATLNARKGLRGPRPETRNDDISLGQVTQSKATHTFLGTQSRRAPNNISIKIDTTQEFVRDEYTSSITELKNGEVLTSQND
ncbi:hypothetical protein JVT61DRAFT_13163 [Boletus reticuloceps]|uniref:DUF6534 domain-containing protein n=1 Tax=Boletus reticuloceps TaxID=495285 RepID=A0A8I2YWC4_9AGAM|nr:hypothetical protein JVT61DRAFT_13163 [Boletus reticuloceps]